MSWKIVIDKSEAMGDCNKQRYSLSNSTQLKNSAITPDQSSATHTQENKMKASSTPRLRDTLQRVTSRVKMTMMTPEVVTRLTTFNSDL